MNGVASTVSASFASGLLAPAVISATLAPASRAARIASPVAQVPPSCETPMTTPPGQGSSAASKAWRGIGPTPGRPARRHASPRIAAAAIAPCSLVPQPVMATGVPGCSSKSTSCLALSANAGTGTSMRATTRPKPSKYSSAHR